MRVLGTVLTMNPSAGLVHEAAEFKPKRAGEKNGSQMRELKMSGGGRGC